MLRRNQGFCRYEEDDEEALSEHGIGRKPW
jgi:hypothetical protein